MELGPAALLKIVVPKVPLLLKTIILNYLGYSECSERTDARTEAVVTIIRSLLQVKRPMKTIQESGLKDPGIKGPLWIAKAIALADGTHVREAVIKAIKELGDGSEQFDLPDVADVEGEWTGHRSNVEKKTPRPDLPEPEQYEQLMREVTSDLTILYFHGGAYCLMDPISHRVLNASLAKKTGGRTFNVRYRLAPQHAFPSQLLDALQAYLYLLSPPAGAFHKPVPADKIVFAGDSAGVDTIHYHGKDVKVQLPAGIAGNSPWLDITRSLPSVADNSKYDYLDPPSQTGLPEAPWPADDVWPTKPPRAEIFCHASDVTHPLVSPLAASKHLWKGSPPAFMCLGNEGLEDEITVLARRMYEAGGNVVFAGYQGQPHCFGMIFPTSVAGSDCINKWAQFCLDAAKGVTIRKDIGEWMKGRSNPPQFEQINLEEMGPSDAEVERLMQRRKQEIMDKERQMLKQYEQSGAARL